MGQYYKFCSFDEVKSICPHTFDNGAKLMEHAYIGNNLMAAAERLISKGGAWFGNKIGWCGDYADPEVDENGEVLKEEHDGKMYDVTMYSLAKEIPYFDLMAGLPKPKRKLRYLVNLDTKEFVDLNKVPTFDETWQIHPLPLLTNEGCAGGARGGGDFRGDDPNGLVGKWARNRVIMQETKPKDCEELIFDLVE